MPTIPRDLIAKLAAIGRTIPPENTEAAPRRHPFEFHPDEWETALESSSLEDLIAVMKGLTLFERLPDSACAGIYVFRILDQRISEHARIELLDFIFKHRNNG